MLSPFRFLSFRTDDNVAISGSGFSSTGSMKCRLQMYVSLVICFREVKSLLPHACVCVCTPVCVCVCVHARLCVSPFSYSVFVCIPSLSQKIGLFTGTYHWHISLINPKAKSNFSVHPIRTSIYIFQLA